MSDQPEPESLSQSDYAARRKVSRQYINKLVKAGRLPLTMDGQIIVAEADAVMGVAEDETAPDAEGASYNDLARRKLAAEAQLAEIRLGERDGTLVERTEVTRSVQNFFGTMRERFADLPVKVAGKVLTLKTEREVAQEIREAIDGEFAAFAKSLLDMFGGSDDDDPHSPSVDRLGGPDGGHGDVVGADAAAPPPPEQVG